MRDGTVHEYDLHVEHEHDGEGVLLPLYANVHTPSGTSHGTIILAHGFKGYKDYGMFPYLARSAADRGSTAIRFNFAHSGMTPRIDTFERPDLFERDTWNRQVADLQALVSAVRAGDVPGCNGELPITLFGHSRGGIAVLLYAGRGGDVQRIITAAAPCTARAPDDPAHPIREELKATGRVRAESSRTGQLLHQGAQFFTEADANKAAHDPIKMAANIGQANLPIKIIHGAADTTVLPAAAKNLAAAANTAAHLLPSATHTFNTKNPLPESEAAAPQLQSLAAYL